MKLLNFEDIEQNTDQWLLLRAGNLTSSNMGKVMANLGKAFGEPAKKLAIDIAVERITGTPVSNGYSNEHMDRGHEQEPIARQLYEDRQFCAITNGGFFHSDGLGCSPDGLVSTEGVIEIKSVIPSVHYANVKRAGIDPSYKWQVLSNLMFTGRKWIDFVSYCSEFPVDQQLYVHRTFADQQSEQFANIRVRIRDFMALVDASQETILTAEYNLTRKAA